MVKSNVGPKLTGRRVTWARYVSVFTGVLALSESLIKVTERYHVLNDFLGHAAFNVLAGLVGAILSYFASREAK